MWIEDTMTKSPRSIPSKHEALATVGLMFDRRRWRWANLSSTLGQRLVLAGYICYRTQLTQCVSCSDGFFQFQCFSTSNSIILLSIPFPTSTYKFCRIFNFIHLLQFILILFYLISEKYPNWNLNYDEFISFKTVLLQITWQRKIIIRRWY